MLSPRRQEPFAETRLKIFALGRMDRREESYKNRAGSSRNDLRHLKLVSQTPVALFSYTNSTSFGLSSLKQTSEHQHKHFALHCKQLTAS